MRSFAKQIQALGIVAVVVPTLWSGEAQASAESCAQLLRRNISQQITKAIPQLNEGELCGETVSGEEALAALSSLTLGEKKASQSLLCDSAKSSKKLVADARRLRSLVNSAALVEYDRCLELSKRGASVKFNPSNSGDGAVNVIVELSRPGVEFQGVTVEPTGSMVCEGFHGAGLFQSQSILGMCRRNLRVPAPASIIRARLNRGLINFRVEHGNIDSDDANIQTPRWERPVLPAIRDCRVLSVADRTFSCFTPLGQNLCYRELRAGNVLDCRSEIAPTIFENVREVQRRFGEGEFAYRRGGALGVTVFQGAPDRGVLSGRIDYGINFDVPVLAQRPNSQCDRSCPLFGDEEPCNRNCVFAEHILESESAFGVEWLTREAGNSCVAELTGSVQLSNIDRHRAYNLCAAEEAWGRTVTLRKHVQVSRFYYFNDPRTTHVVVNGTRNGRPYRYERWEVINAGERRRDIAELSLPVTVACNRR